MAAQDINEFELARKRAQQENTAALQRQKDALTRRFAQLGNLNSGARLKLEQQTEEAGQKQLQSANESIDAAERAENRRRQELQEGREFARQERLGSQEFAGQQADLGRRFQSGEREASQGFAAGQADLARKFQTGERLGGQEFAGQQAAMQRAFMTGERLGGEKFAGEQADMQRRYQTGERLGSEQFARGERAASQQFAGEQAGLQRAFAAGESDLARRHDAGQRDLERIHQQRQFDTQLGFNREQFAQAQAQFNISVDQFNKTFTEEQRINNKNLEFAEKMLNEKGFLETVTGGGLSVGGQSIPMPWKVVGDTLGRWF